MKLSIAAATIAGLLCWYVTTSSAAIARAAQTHAGPGQNSQASDFSARRRSRHRHPYDGHYARPLYEPYYYGRPTEYRPYGLVPFFFGLSFPYRTQ